MNNHELFRLCKKYGTEAREARNKFAGLLPEVLRRKLYKEKGFGSIYHFAAVLAGMSREQVQRAIQLEHKFIDKPALRKALVNGEISINKLARVASIATKENQEELAEKAKVLPSRALETFVRDVKYENQEDSIKPLFGGNSVHVHRIELSDKVNKKLRELKEKGIDINELLLELLQKREQQIAEEKTQLAEEAGIKVVQINKKSKKLSKYINVRTKRLLKKEHGTKCSIPHCQKSSTQIHHTQRFALANTHNPYYLAPLCRQHHQIAHTIDIKFQKKMKPQNLSCSRDNIKTHTE